MDQQWKGNALFLFHGITCHDCMLYTVTYLAGQYAEKVLLPFHDKNICANAPGGYIVRKFCTVLYFFALQRFLLLGFRVIFQPNGHFFYEKFLSVY